MFRISADTSGTLMSTQQEQSTIYQYNPGEYIAYVYNQTGMLVALFFVMRRDRMFLSPSRSKLVPLGLSNGQDTLSVGFL